MSFLSLFLFLSSFLVSNINIFMYDVESVKKHDICIGLQSYKLEY